MARSPRKEREIQEREELILNVARTVLVEEGFPALSMDRIAAEIEYSKGTVYQHFQSKEDVLAALAVQTHRKRTEFFERAATFRGKPRERIMAIGVADDLFVRLFPSHFRAEQIILLTSEPERLEGERLRKCYEHENRCFEICCGIIRDAVASGDLEIQAPQAVETITFGLWAMCFGAHFIGHTLGRFKDLAIADGVFPAIGLNVNTLLDGLDFAPLSRDWDYHASVLRARQEIFPAETAELGH
jgi:AcrR family transcriptional regulator